VLVAVSTTSSSVLLVLASYDVEIVVTKNKLVWLHNSFLVYHFLDDAMVFAVCISWFSLTPFRMSLTLESALC
jgi:hypothetical protein